MKLAMSILHESTILGSKHYRFWETAAVLELFPNFWFMVNVMSPTTGKHKRDIIRDVKSCDNWKLDYV